MDWIYMTNNKLTPWNWVNLEQPPVVQLLKKFSGFYGTRRFITVFTRALHWSLSWARLIQSVPPYFISGRSILILSTHLRLGISNGLFPSGFPTNILYAFLFSPFVLHNPSISSSLSWSFCLYLTKSASYECYIAASCCIASIWLCVLLLCRLCATSATIHAPFFLTLNVSA
jgi:hypothetical protein